MKYTIEELSNKFIGDTNNKEFIDLFYDLFLNEEWGSFKDYVKCVFNEYNFYDTDESDAQIYLDCISVNLYTKICTKLLYNEIKNGTNVLSWFSKFDKLGLMTDNFTDAVDGKYTNFNGFYLKKEKEYTITIWIYKYPYSEKQSIYQIAEEYNSGFDNISINFIATCVNASRFFNTSEVKKRITMNEVNYDLIIATADQALEETK